MWERLRGLFFFERVKYEYVHDMIIQYSSEDLDFET